MLSIQCTSFQVHINQEHINKLQLFLEELPELVPTYAIYLETQDQCILKALFRTRTNRSPYILSNKAVERKIFWFIKWTDMENQTLIKWQLVPKQKE